MNDMNKKYHSKLQESKISKYLGWEVVKGSGNRPNHPGDIISEDWLGECKTHMTTENIIKFNFDTWDKICIEAMSQFKEPVLFVDNGSKDIYKTFCMIDISDQLNILPNYKDDYTEKSSYSFNLDDEDIDIYFVKIIQRKNKVLCVMSLEQFKAFIEII